MWYSVRAKFALVPILLTFLVPLAPLATRAQSDDPAAGPPLNPVPFAEWLVELRVEALADGIPEALFDAVFDGIEPNMRVIELDNRQPEFTITYGQYITGRVTETRIERGLAAMILNNDSLRAVAASYGVQGRFIAAIWGMETNYGTITGNMSVIRSLATLAWDPRRSSFFRKELLAALKILDEGHIAPEAMIGSWAGAMGQSQFMPSSFFGYAQDFDGDGRRDIWGNVGDVFASIANYLKRAGWRDDMTWGRQVILPDNFIEFEDNLAENGQNPGCSRAMRQHSKLLSLREWQELGVRRLNGGDLPSRDFQASLVRPSGSTGPAYLVYANYRAILRYNCSNFYALAVGQLADTLRSGE